MTLRCFPQDIRKQHGQILMILLILLVAGGITLFVHTAHSNHLQTGQDRQTDAALMQAKEALLAYATAYPENHAGEVFGYLPCPDLGSAGFPEGSAAGNCGQQNITVVGRLPWRTLGLPPLRDGNGDCLWYAISGNYKNNPKTDLMSWDTNGLMPVYAADGTTLLTESAPTGQAVAVIFSPGRLLDGQNRSNAANTQECGGNYTASNYLDSDKTSGINNATTSALPGAISNVMSGALNSLNDNTSTVNDKLAFITVHDIFARHIEKRTDFPGYLYSATTMTSLLYQIANCLAVTAKPVPPAMTASFPWAVPMNIANYGNDNLYKEGASSSAYAGRVPFNNVSTCLVDNEWWDNWKDNLFYAVSKAFKSGGSCTGSADCLSVNGGNYAAVLVFSGKKLGSQVRNNNTDKGNVANYLESDNLSTFNANDGTGKIKTSSPTSTFNDSVICINKNFQVVPNCDNP